jgi:RNA polymerase sigma factor (sigma-70 family)
MKTTSEQKLPADGPLTWSDVLALQDELKRIIRGLLAGDGQRGAIKTTALLVSMFRRLQGAHKDWRQNPRKAPWPDWHEVTWANREEFLKHARKVIRQAIVDAARERRRLAEHQAGGFQSADVALLVEAGALSPQRLAVPEMSEQAEAVARALEIMERDYPDLAAVIQHTFLDGCTQVEIARLLGCSDRTVRTKLRLARTILAELLRRESAPDAPPE